MTTWTEALRRAEVVAVGASLARQGLIRSREGNISCRLDAHHFLLTPRGSDKRRLNAKDLLVIPLAGPIPGMASSEAPLHLETYRHCPEVGAVVHAHPANVLALETRGRMPSPQALKEGEAMVPRVARVPVHPPGSEALALACARALKRAPVAVMARHGVVAGGADLWEALARVEVVELLARLALEHYHGGAIL